MAAQGGLPASAAAAAPSLNDGSAPHARPVDAHDLAAPELNVEPQAQDPDRITVDEAEDSDDGAMQPWQFLGAAEDDDGGSEPEPVADVDVTPTVANDGPPALSAATAGCTPKAWHEKDQPAFKDRDNLTDEFLSFFAQFPKPKDTPWAEQPADFQNTQHCEEEPQATGPAEGGLNMEFWENMTKHGHDHDVPTKEEIMDPLWLLFINITVTFWRNLAINTDAYASQVYSKLCSLSPLHGSYGPR